MAIIINFPIDIRYRVFGINRDGRIIIQILNTPQQFMMYAENILETPHLIKYFSKHQVSWLCDIVQLNRKEQVKNSNKSNI